MNQTQNSAPWVTARALLLGAALIGLQAAGGCGKVKDEDTGSETHWLVRCDADAECGAAGSCECGVCTRSCVLASDCAALGIAGVQCLASPLGCAAPEASYGNTPPSSLCLLPCSEDDDCQALGADATCTAGHCELESGINSGAGGSSSSNGGGAGGGSATGGTGGAADVPTLCDGSEDVRFVSLIGGGFVSPFFYFAETYGSEFYAIDGQCRYWHGFNDGRVYSGTLAAERAESFARTLDYGRLAQYGNYVGDSCPDAGGRTLWTPDGTVSCVCNCTNDQNAPAGWRAAFAADDSARRDLLAGEQAVVTEPAQLALLPLSMLDGNAGDPGLIPELWPLERPPAPSEVLDPGAGAGVPIPESAGAPITEPGELNQLRATRAAYRARTGNPSSVPLLSWTDPGTQTVRYFSMFLRDEVPPAVRAALEQAASSR